MSTDLRTAATYLLDTPGVHPWNDSWHSAYDLFFALVKEGSIEDAIDGVLDFLSINDGTVRLKATLRFWQAFDFGIPEAAGPSRFKRLTTSVGAKFKQAFAPSSIPE